MFSTLAGPYVSSAATARSADLPAKGHRQLGRRAGTAAALGLAFISGLLAAPAQAAPAPAAAHAAQAASSTAFAALSRITLTGHGFGHGRGMGQYGAYGYAVAYAYPASKILARFYGGTRLVTSPVAAASQKITVRLTAWDGVNVRITSPHASFRAGGVVFPAGKVAVLQYSATTRAVTVSSTSSCTSTSVSPLARIDSGAALVTSSVAAPGADVSKMLNVCAGSVLKAYRGSLTYRSVDATNPGRRLINSVGVDDYLRGVVPREMPASWGDAAGGRGFQALQAQAVVARSYALASPPHRPYAKVCDTAVCQVYGGAGSGGRLIEDNRATRAVSATTGRVLVNSSGAIAKTEFSASTGGFSAGGVFPAVSDAGDARAPGNIYHSWTTTVPTTPLQDKYRSQIGDLKELRVTKRDSGNRRVISVRLYGTDGRYTDPISGDEIASLLGLYSNWFTVA